MPGKEWPLIPMHWVLAAYVSTTSFVIAAAVWAFSIDARLARLEQKAGIDKPIVEQTALTPEAYAHE